MGTACRFTLGTQTDDAEANQGDSDRDQRAI
jgi:hypothetical protein